MHEDLTKRAVEALKAKAQGGSKASRGAQESPLRVAVREAWDAVKKDNFDGFAEAFENALKIKAADRE